jgi:hypothetical protein
MNSQNTRITGLITTLGELGTGSRTFRLSSTRACSGPREPGLTAVGRTEPESPEVPKVKEERLRPLAVASPPLGGVDGAELTHGHGIVRTGGDGRRRRRRRHRLQLQLTPLLLKREGLGIVRCRSVACLLELEMVLLLLLLLLYPLVGVVAATSPKDPQPPGPSLQRVHGYSGSGRALGSGCPGKGFTGDNSMRPRRASRTPAPGDDLFVLTAEPLDS